MYHIKSDKRSQTSSEMLYQALRGLMKDEDFGEISVTELVNRAQVGRSTFYRNFDSITDVLYWKCDCCFAEVLRSFTESKPQGGDPLGLLQYVFGYWQENSEILEMLFRINRIDIIYECFEKNSHIVMDEMKERLSLSAEQYEYFIATRIGIFVGVIRTWLNRGKKEDSRQITAMLGEQFLPAADGGLVF